MDSTLSPTESVLETLLADYEPAENYHLADELFTTPALAAIISEHCGTEADGEAIYNRMISLGYKTRRVEGRGICWCLQLK